MDFIFNFSTKVDDKYYYLSGKYKGNICKMLEEEMDDDTTVYQWRRKYVRKNQNKLVPTLTANMGEGGQMSDARLYKQAGNSVVVPIINRIAENIFKALG